MKITCHPAPLLGLTMKCDNCGSETIAIRNIYHEDGTVDKGCKYCIHTTPLTNFRITDYTGKVKIGASHRADIKRRRYDFKTGQTYRDYGKKYFFSHT